MKSEDNKHSFENWLKNNSVSTEVLKCCAQTTSGLASIGLPIKDLFAETNPVLVRLYASELILKRNHCGLNSVNEFEQAIRFLVLYADYLEKKDVHKKPTTPKQHDRDKTRDSLILAYYLSRENKEAVRKLGYKTFREAFREIGLLLGQKHTTIKNMRDEFDPYFDNGRAGWYQRQLSASRKEVFDLLKNVPVSQLDEMVSDIISEYKGEESISKEESGHKKIIISSGNMKEFKAKKK